MTYKKPSVELLTITPLKYAELAGRVCYDSFDQSENEIIKNFDPTDSKDIEGSELLNKLSWVTYHHSVLEHINMSFFIKDLPRNVVLEMNRHRIGVATSQKSSRFTIDVLINAYVESKGDFSSTVFRDVVEKNISVTDFKMVSVICDYLWAALETLDIEEELILNLKGKKKKAQNDKVKFILPECWTMEGIWTFNLRSLKLFLDLRLSNNAYYAIQDVAEDILEELPSKYKELIRKKV